MCEGYKEKSPMVIVGIYIEEYNQDKRKSKVNLVRIEIDSRLFDLER